MDNEKLDDTYNSKDKHSNYHSPIKSIFDKFSRQKDVSFVYGEPIDFENKRVLPVAKVNYYVGGGGGYSGKSDEESVDQGEGGGGYFSVKPVGVYEITSEKVKFKPVFNLNFILILFTILTFGFVWLMKKSR